jgi:hypothetical protein
MDSMLERVAGLTRTSFSVHLQRNGLQGSVQDRRSVCGYRAIFVSSAVLSSLGYDAIDGQPAVYLHIAALDVNVLNCRRQGLRTAMALAPLSAGACRTGSSF